ncbi:MAG: bifunctional serine/threonine-protein kinase/formylglycine-generating enzyme family protein [Chitinophagales bacterium]
MLNSSLNGYTLKKIIGSGGMADVYYAENKLGLPAAIKVLKKKFCDEKSVHDRFIQEAQIMVGLDHPNIRKVFDIGELHDQPAIIMEYLDGHSLSELLHAQKKFDSEDLKAYFAQCCDALRYTHSRNIIHRDIKPSNIFLTKDGQIKIVDFGIAKVKEGKGHTNTGQTLGTVVYMSPEQVKDPKRLNYKTDNYSLAVTFFHLLTGEAPYDLSTDSDWAVQTKIVHEELDLGKVPTDWQKVLKPLLLKDAQKRSELSLLSFDTPEALKKKATNEVARGQKQPFVEDKPTPTPPPKKPPLPKTEKTEVKPPPKPPDPPKSQSSWWLLVLGLLVIAGAYYFWTANSSQTADTFSSPSDEAKIVPSQNAIIAQLEKNMVYVAGGSFTMGCTSEQGSDCYNYEKPAHTVSVQSFYIGKYEVTQEEWRAVMGSDPPELYFKGCDRCPVESVSWNDAQDFLKKLNAQTGKNYRLPSEAEWEYAARGGNKSKGYKYAGSDNINVVARYGGNSNNKTQTVGGKQANELGIYDMSGNVYEWCNDWYKGYPGAVM